MPAPPETWLPPIGGDYLTAGLMRVIVTQASPLDGSQLTAVVYTDPHSGETRLISWGTNVSTTTQTSLYANMPLYQEGTPVFTPHITGIPYYHMLSVNQPLIISSVTSIAEWTNLAMYGSVVPRSLPKPAIIRMREREAERRGRRALQRSLTLFRRFRPDEELRTFLDGKPLLVHGHQYDYQITKTVDLLRHTIDPESFHVPYDLRIKEKDGKFLAQGCVIFPLTPVIDQILALIFHVQDEHEEEKIINITNWTPRLTRKPRIFVPEQMAA